MAKPQVKSSEQTVGVRELKAKLSEHLDLVKSGATLTVTEHGKPVARLVPIERIDPPEWLKPLIESGAVRWSGLPFVLREPIVPAGTGKTFAEMISEDREDRF